LTIIRGLFSFASVFLHFLHERAKKPTSPCGSRVSGSKRPSHQHAVERLVFHAVLRWTGAQALFGVVQAADGADIAKLLVFVVIAAAVCRETYTTPFGEIIRWNRLRLRGAITVFKEFLRRAFSSCVFSWLHGLHKAWNPPTSQNMREM
jgi:hypothetical protein